VCALQDSSQERISYFREKRLDQKNRGDDRTRTPHAKAAKDAKAAEAPAKVQGLSLIQLDWFDWFDWRGEEQATCRSGRVPQTTQSEGARELPAKRAESNPISATW
jgi:hypothetical protein